MIILPLYPCFTERDGQSSFYERSYPPSLSLSLIVQNLFTLSIFKDDIENIDRHIYVQSLKNLPSNNMGTNQKCRALLRKHAGYENGWTRVAKGKLDRRARRFEIGLHESKKVCPAAFLAQCLAVRDKD